MYFVNGYKFHTQDWSHGKKTTNCGVHVKGLTNGGEDDYYGIIQNILQLEYNDFDDKITLFHCEWFDPTKNSGTRVQKQYNIVDIKMNKRYRQYDMFLLAQKQDKCTMLLIQKCVETCVDGVRQSPPNQGVMWR
jgi:hypothetical protein